MLILQVVGCCLIGGAIGGLINILNRSKVSKDWNGVTYITDNESGQRFMQYRGTGVTKI